MLGSQISSATLRADRSEEHTSELQSQSNLVCRLLLEKKNNRRPVILRPQRVFDVADKEHHGQVHIQLPERLCIYAVTVEASRLVNSLSHSRSLMSPSR